MTTKSAILLQKKPIFSSSWGLFFPDPLSLPMAGSSTSRPVTGGSASKSPIVIQEKGQILTTLFEKSLSAPLQKQIFKTKITSRCNQFYFAKISIFRASTSGLFDFITLFSLASSLFKWLLGTPSSNSPPPVHTSSYDTDSMTLKFGIKYLQQ